MKKNPGGISEEEVKEYIGALVLDKPKGKDGKIQEIQKDLGEIEEIKPIIKTQKDVSSILDNPEKGGDNSLTLEEIEQNIKALESEREVLDTKIVYIEMERMPIVRQLNYLKGLRYNLEKTH